jgi:hypothetical protein
VTEEKTSEPGVEICKLCGGEVTHDLSGHLWRVHGMTLGEYETWSPGRQRAKVVDVGTVKPIPPPPPPPPPPEPPKVTIRLAPIDSNPPTAGVEARRGRSYFFVKGEWQTIPAPDAWILLPRELHPGKYAELVFERQEPEDG